MDNTICPKCKSVPDRQFSNGVFTTYVCYPKCGFIFWKLLVCPYCEQPNSTTLLKKPNFGQKISCQKCKQSMYFFLCPQSSCEQIFYKHATSYSMGDVVVCQNEQCQHKFKNLTCPCGSEFKLDKNTMIFQGSSSYNCECCKQKLIYTVCAGCGQPEYHIDPLTPGDRIRCGSCKQWRKYVPCPFCGKCLPGKQFSYFQPIHCHYCQIYFQFCRCAYNCSSVGFNELKSRMGPERNCYSCKQAYAVINCLKCHQSLFREYLKPSNQAQIQSCPICKNRIQFFYCPCGMFNHGVLQCQNCRKKPKTVNDTIKLEKQKKAKQTKEEPTQEEKTCKLCFERPSTVINQVCGHIAMCSQCSTKFLNGNVQQSKACPICRTIGRYFGYKEPIFS